MRGIKKEVKFIMQGFLIQFLTGFYVESGALVLVCYAESLDLTVISVRLNRDLGCGIAIPS